MKKILSLVCLQIAMIIFIACVLFITSCSDDDAAPALPNVTSVSPLTGTKATIVIISGSNFSTSLVENKVTFNGKAGVITDATLTQLTVIVPPAADSGPVIVSTKEKTAANQPTFAFQWSVTTVAGTSAGYENGSVAKFNTPTGVTVDPLKNLYVTDYGNHVIRKITPGGVVSTLSGSTDGMVNGAGSNAKFANPNGCVIDEQGNVFVSEEYNCLVRKITGSGETSTFAGSAFAFNYADGVGTAAQFYGPSGITIDDQGNLYVADQFNHRIRKITSAGVVTTLAGSTQGSSDGTGTSAQFSRPVGVVADASGNVYVGDLFNHRVRKITAAGVVTTLAGSSYGFSNGIGTVAQFAYPAGLALDKNGNLYVADTENHKIRKISSEGVVTTFAGTTQGNTDGLVASAQFYMPREIDIDDEGVMYIADAGNHRIRRID